MTPVQPDRETQLKRDDDHINLLAIFHFLMAGFSLIGIAFLTLHFFMMSTILGSEGFMNAEEMNGQFEDAFSPMEFLNLFRWFYLLMGIFFIADCIINLLSAIFMKQRRYRTFSMVVAGLNCLFVPVGTLLGVFTIMVLMRPTMEASYWENSDES